MPAPKGNQYAVGNQGGRPAVFDVNDVIEKLNAYIDVTEEPMVKEFCLEYGISSNRFYVLKDENEELRDSIKRLIDKEEMFLVKNAERQKINPVFAMFRLKQPAFGYKDKQEIETTGETTVNNKVDLSNFTTDQLKEILKNE